MTLHNKEEKAAFFKSFQESAFGKQVALRMSKGECLDDALRGSLDAFASLMESEKINVFKDMMFGEIVGKFRSQKQS